VFIILGNDDGRFEEDKIIQSQQRGIWEYIHNKKVQFEEYLVFIVKKKI